MHKNGKTAQAAQCGTLKHEVQVELTTEGFTLTDQVPDQDMLS